MTESESELLWQVGNEYYTDFGKLIAKTLRKVPANLQEELKGRLQDSSSVYGSCYEKFMNLDAYILIGAPGSGKSTHGKNMVAANPAIVRLCPDEFRAKFGTGENDQSVSNQAFGATRQGMRDALTEGKSVLIDATNMYRKTRKDFLDIAKDFNAKTIAIVFEATKETLLERNIQRGLAGGRNVPEDVIDKMLGRYERPNELEFNEVIFITKLELVQ